MAYLDESGLSRFWTHIMTKLGGKVDKEDGKGLSTNDFTTAEKDKLAGLDNITVDSYLTSIGTNPVQGKVIYSEIYDPKRFIKLSDFYGDTFLLKIEKNSLATQKVPTSIIVGQLNKTQFYDGDYFTLDDCPEVTGVFRSGNVVLDKKNDVRFTLYYPPNYWSGVGITESGGASLQYPNEYKLKIYYNAGDTTLYEEELFITTLELPTLFNSYFNYSNEDWTTTIQDSSFNTSPLDLNKNYKMIFNIGENTTSYPATVYYYTQEDGYDENRYEFYCSGIDYPPYSTTFDANIIYYESSGTVEMQIYCDYSIEGSVRLAEDMQGEE